MNTLISCTCIKIYNNRSLTGQMFMMTRDKETELPEEYYYKKYRTF